MHTCDDDWLADWIQPHHLDPAARECYREQFHARVGPYLVLDNLLSEPVARQVSDFLTQEARFRRSVGIRGTAGEVSEARWLETSEEDRFFSYRVLDEAQWGSELTPAAAAFVALRKAFQDPRFAGYGAAVTGLSFGTDTEVGTHGLVNGDFLKWHRDLGHNRRLAFLLYISPGWQTDYGGALHLVDMNGVEETVEPRFKRLLLFDVVANQGHWVAEVTAPAGRSRLSVGGWLHAP